jgi:SAM-dependent methyltransferase
VKPVHPSGPEQRDAQDRLKDEIRSLGPWHHDVTIAEGIRTGDPALAPAASPEHGTVSITDPFQLLGEIVPALFEHGMAGRSFLDCGCNAGGYVFAATALGAHRAYGFDARQHWIDQAHFLMRHLPSDGARFGCHTLAELPGLALEPFDVTLFSGLFYHLPDPVAGLRIAADMTRDLLIVNTATRPGPGHALVLNIESDELVMSGVDRLAWMPTGPGVVEAILRWCGFPHTRLVFHRATDDGGRLIILAARRAAMFDRMRTFDAPRHLGLAGRARSAIGRLLRG